MRDDYPKAPVEHLLRQERSLAPLFLIRETFPKAEVFLVGGAVRDAILGRPCTDFDFVVRGVPEDELVQWMAMHGEVNFVGRVFGVYKFTPTGSRTIFDVALPRTERADAYRKGSRRSFVIETNAFLPIIEDLARRDFTMNAMAYEINAGILYDPFSGIKDMKAGVIRAVGDATHRFQEDLSRMLRCVRFACELNMEIEPRTWEALRVLVPAIGQQMDAEKMTDRFRGKHGAFIVPREIVGCELVKSLTASLSKAVVLWRESGLFAVLSPTLSVVLPSEIPYLHVSPQAALAFLLAPLGKERALTFYESVSLSSIGSDDPRFVSKEHVGMYVHTFDRLARAEDFARLSAPDFAEIFLAPFSEDLLTFLLLAKGHLPVEKQGIFLEAVEEIRARREKMQQRIGVENAEELSPLMTGEDIMQLMRIKAGPALGAWVKKLRELQLEGDITTAEDAKAFLVGARLL